MSKRCMGCMELYADQLDVCPHCGYVDGTPADEAIHLKPGTLLHNRYIVGRALGFGGFGVTYIGWDGRLEQKVAIKEYLPSEFSTRMPGQSSVTVFSGDKQEQFRDGLSKFVDEAKRLARFQNEPGIVRIFDSFPENDTAYIIMEYLEGETLAARLAREGTIPEDEAVEMLRPVMHSLEVVHREGLLHRDIAPDNLFLTSDGQVKLIDFGASRYATTTHSRSLTVIIKPGFSPEEQYRSRGDQGPHTDVYALAATLYKMVTGKTPPDAMERRAMVETKRRDLLVPPHKYSKGISTNREIAILNAMNVQIEDRTPDIPSFLEELDANPPAKRIYGKIKKVDLYTWPLWLKILVPAALCAVLTVGALLATGVISFKSLFSGSVEVPTGMTVVPDLEGMDKDKAVAALTKAKLNATAGGNAVSEFIEAGKIVYQTPMGGSFLEEQGTVALTISSGNGVIPPLNGEAYVPYVVWDLEEDALAKLKEAGLGEPILKEQNDETVDVGKIISQSIEYGEKVPEGTQLTLVVSLGPEVFDMPDVVGKTQEEAEKALSASGLTVNLSYGKSNDVPQGSVIAQSVAAGAGVRRGNAITLTICTGRATFPVPNVVSKSRSDAEAALKNVGFTVEAVERYDSAAAGTVVAQNPGSDTEQAEGARITITVSKGPQPVTVSFDGNGGSVSGGSVTLHVGGTYGSLPSATRSGYNFAGWYTAKSGGSRVESGTKVSNASNHTLYAQWSAGSITVTLDANGGFGKKLSEVLHDFGGDFVISRIMKGDEIVFPTGDTVLD
ncbi:MAG: PASTA domain-containing protein, partial [Oscillospiraceae bacterium]|nr:PASTA domain-containing protein [Oscillospiraceae bacterium]